MNQQYMIAHNFNLKQYNTMRIESNAETVLFPFSKTGVLQALNEHDDSIVILGNGSNVILSKPFYKKVFLISNMLCNLSIENGSIIAEGGVSLSNLAWFALENGISGYEYLEDIPGTVGGALCMNAGTYEDNIGFQVEEVTVYSFKDKAIKTLSSNDISSYWGKRDSYFIHFHNFIISCKLKIDHKKSDYYEIIKNMTDIKIKRYNKQPRNYPSAGSVFKRPYVNGEPRYIWKLFDEAGLRGYRIGDAMVSDKHPGFIVNVGNATGEDVLRLVNYCKKIVKEKYDIEIEEEWRII